MELPEPRVGLNRAEPILTFLQKSESQELRVIGIHGLPGVGKSTLANYIWQEASSIAPFRACAHVQIGPKATTQRLCSLQSSILQQLGGERYEFTSPESGKQKLTEHFRQLRGDSSKCNQSALKKGFELFSKNAVVTMHDLTLKFGERLRTHVNFTTRRDFQSIEGLLQSLEAPKLMRNLMLWSTYPEGDPELEFLKKATSLQVLLLHAIEENDGFSLFSSFNPVSENIFTAGQYTSLDAAPYPGGLRYLSLAGWNSSTRIMEMKLSREVREINLYCCGDVKQLPDTPLHQLERLSIIKCELFEGFSPSCVRNWHKLKDLMVLGSERITSLPAELRHLESLRSLHFGSCSGLETFPSLCNAEGPSQLEKMIALA